MNEKETGGACSQQPTSRVRKTDKKTAAARYNRAIYQRLGAALRKHPEADLTVLMPQSYSTQLELFQCPSPEKPNVELPVNPNDIRAGLVESDPCTILGGLSDQVKLLTRGGLSECLISLLTHGEVIFGRNSATCMVLRIHQNIVVKVTRAELKTEHSSLLYLQQNLPDFPAPRPHGLVQLGRVNLLFMTYMQGLGLDSVWSRLNPPQKESIRSQLDTLFSSLRSIQFSHNVPLGGIQGEGCKDIRRDARTSPVPIQDETRFFDFIFAGCTTASPLYKQLLRDLMPLGKRVFTHGDLRPANVIVVVDDDENWKVSAIIDWEASGVYPEYWESVKMTNDLTPSDTGDWYKYLPESISFRRYAIPWLVDRLCDPLMHNS